MSLVTRSGSQFIQDDKPFRFVGANQYALAIGSMTQPQISSLFKYASQDGIKVMRTWAFDTSVNGPFHSLNYPVTTNLIANYSFETDTSGWTLGSDYTRTNSDAEDGAWSIKQVSSGGYSSLTSSAITVTANTNYVLTFWTKLQNTWGMAPVIFIGSTAGANDVKDGGFNSDTGGVWQRKQVLFNSVNHTTIYISIENWSGGANGFYDNFSVSVQANPTLTINESTYKQLDMVLDEARKAGIKLILSLMDSNENNFNSKKTFVTWANAVYGLSIPTNYPYSGFFTDSHCQQMYKDFVTTLVNRINTINQRPYKTDDAIFSWELGNEIRLNLNDTTGQNTINGSNLSILSKLGGWADTMSTFIKSIDPNHLVGFGDSAHTWQWVSGDTISNGTYYGVDYSIIATLPHIDYLDFHLYPTQANPNLIQTYGVRLGFPAVPTKEGLQAQLLDFIAVGHANNKPVICTEWGLVKEMIGQANLNQVYPIYPRVEHFKQVFKDFLDKGGDGFMIWSYSTGNAGYEIYAYGSDGPNQNENFDDFPLKDLLLQYSYNLEK